jgi:restriction system protein
MFGDADILGTWLQLLLSPFGLMLVGLTILTALVNSATRGPRRDRAPRWVGRRAPRGQSSWKANLRTKADREVEPLVSPGSNPTLDEIMRLSPGGFEEFVADLFHRTGYAVKVVGGDGDHGVDLVVTNPEGKRELVQCKRWDRKWIGEPVVREFYGALMHDGSAVRGYIVTTSFFSNAARRWAEGKPMSLIDGEELTQAADRILAMRR